MPGTLYVVATPIGNLDDLTIRAGRILGEVEIVLAEDTRRTRGLLSHLGLSKPLRRLDAHASTETITETAREIAEGACYALVSDAGTPVVSDPGAELVAATIAAGGVVVAIPGASAVLTALVASGLAGHGFRFFGFLPRGGGERSEVLAKIVATEEPVVFYESGPRTRDTIADLATRMPERPAAIGRELTKLHEEFLRGRLTDLVALLDARAEELRGEVTIVLGSAPPVSHGLAEAEIDARIDAELDKGLHAKAAADVVAAWSGLARREIYARVVARRSARR